MNIVIPMAGEGSRFKQAGYTFPKPLIDVEGKPMIQRVVENIGIEDANYIFLVRQEHIDNYAIDKVVTNLVKKAIVIPVKELTEGAACTVLLAEKYIDNAAPLLIANSDQLVEWKLSIKEFESNGHIYVFNDTHPKWSFVKLNGRFITEVAEKQPISNIATTGIYYWFRGDLFVNSAKKMIRDNIRVNNEFYIAPVYNIAIKEGWWFTVRYVNKMHGLGTPEDLERYLNRD